MQKAKRDDDLFGLSGAYHAAGSIQYGILYSDKILCGEISFKNSFSLDIDELSAYCCTLAASVELHLLAVYGAGKASGLCYDDQIRRIYLPIEDAVDPDGLVGLDIAFEFSLCADYGLDYIGIDICALIWHDLSPFGMRTQPQK